MGRKTQQNTICTPELMAQINSQNIQLKDDYLMYLKSIQRSDTTIAGYTNDLDIFFCWNVEHANNKFFVDITKRDVISYQNWLLNTNKNSPARVRRLKSSLSALSNYIEAICDQDYPQFRNIINKVESPVNQAVREKSVFTDEQLQSLLDILVEKQKYQQACLLALAMCSGRRKSELVRFKVDYFSDENIVFGSLYRTPEKVKTKGRGVNGKPLVCYTLAGKFKPYYDLWMKQRDELGIASEWLFVGNDGQQLKSDTLNCWAETFTRLIGADFYWHSMRHYYTTNLSRLGLPDSVIQSIVGWTSSDMVRLYIDLTTDEELEKYFDENGVKAQTTKGLSDL